MHCDPARWQLSRGSTFRSRCAPSRRRPSTLGVGAAVPSCVGSMTPRHADVMRRRAAAVFACPRRPAGTSPGSGAHQLGGGRRDDAFRAARRPAASLTTPSSASTRASGDGGSARMAVAHGRRRRSQWPRTPVQMRPTHAHSARCASSALDAACVLCRTALCVFMLCAGESPE